MSFFMISPIFGYRLQGKLVFGAILRTAQVGAGYDLSTLAAEVLDGWDRRLNPRLISDLLAGVHWHIEITPDQDLFALEIGQVFDRFLGFEAGHSVVCRWCRGGNHGQHES